MPTKGNILLGVLLFTRYSVSIDLRKNFVSLSILSFHVKPQQSRVEFGTFDLRASPTVVIGPFEDLMVLTFAAIGFFGKLNLIVTLTVEQHQDNRRNSQITNTNAFISTIIQKKIETNFKILTIEQASQFRPMSLQQFSLESSHPNKADNIISQLLQSADAFVDDREARRHIDAQADRMREL